MATQNSWGNQIAAANSAITLNSGTNAVNISTDASATTLSIGTGGAVKGLTLGSTNSTSASTLQSGSGALNVTATDGALTINSGTGTIGISTDASATTCNFATGGAAKVVTLGSTSGASSLALKTGTADFTLASATGTIMSALDTGEITYPLQSAFLAYLANTVNNITGDGTAYTVTYDTEVFDQNGDFNGTTTFTAPVTGKYQLSANLYYAGLAATNATSPRIDTSNRNLYLQRAKSGVINDGGNYSVIGSFLIDMDAGDTAIVVMTAAGGTKVVDALGDSQLANAFSGYLAC
jgi:hypothetical protein